MSSLTPDEARFVEKRRKAAKAGLVLGWSLILLPVVLAPYVWIRVDRLRGMLRHTMAQERVTLQKVQTATPFEATLLREIVKQDEQAGRLAGIVLLGIFGLFLGNIAMQGVSLVASSLQQKRYLRLIDRLDRQAELGTRSGG